MPSMVFISHSSKDRPTADAICDSCAVVTRDPSTSHTTLSSIMARQVEGMNRLSALNPRARVNSEVG
jgi:hypothetical protein